jgi:hypothetical protein
VDAAAAIALDQKGNVIVAGSVQDHTGNWDADSDIAVAKYDGATGRQLWSYRWNGKDNKYDDAKAVAVDTAGNIYVVGNTTAIGPFGNFSDIVTLAFGPGGNLKWKQVYDGPLNQAQDSAQGIALAPNGDVYVTGYSWGDGEWGNPDNPQTNYDFATIKYAGATG